RAVAGRPGVEGGEAGDPLPRCSAGGRRDGEAGQVLDLHLDDEPRRLTRQRRAEQVEVVTGRRPLAERGQHRVTARVADAVVGNARSTVGPGDTAVRSLQAWPRD